MVRQVRRALPFVLAAALILGPAIPAHAAAGDPDPGFGAGGEAFAGFPGRDEAGHAVAVAANGKVIVAGTSESGAFDVEVMRFTTGGVLDNTFDGDGIRKTSFGGTDHGRAVAIQPDGKVVVAGYSLNPAPNSSAIVARYTTTGAFDASFSGDGKKVVNWPGVTQSGAYGVAIQADGKIVLAGFALPGDFAVARLNPNGTYDNTFDGDGRVTIDIGPNDTAFAVAIQDDQKIVVAGNAIADDASAVRFGVARLNTDGTLDGSFSGDGVLRTPFSGEDAYALGVAVQGDGKIVAAGLVTSATATDFALVRYNANGALDTSFAVGGKRSTSFDQNDSANGVAIQGDGKIVAGGATYDGSDTDFALARYTTGGNLDAGFGVGGKVTTGFGAPDFADGVAISPVDGKIVLAGGTLAGPDPSNFAVVRYLVA